MRLSMSARSILAAGLLLATAAPAWAQVDSREGIALQNQIYQLRQELQALHDQVARGAPGGGSSLARPPYAPAPQYGTPQYGAPQYGGNDMVAQLLTRVEALEEQVRQLRGRIDETQNLVQRQGADLTKRIEDLAFQMNPQAAQGAAPPPNQPAPPQAAARPAQPPAPPAAPPSPAQRRTPELAMQEGNAALARRDYATAEQAAREVLANRTSPRAYDAQLLLAQALAGQRQFPQAAIAYDDAYNRSRKGSHAQDALLGLANSLTAINEKKAACDTLARLRSEFPQPRADLRDNIAAAHQKAGCK